MTSLRIICLLLLAACASVPSASPRDAQLLAAGDTRTHLMAYGPAPLLTSSFLPTVFGGSMLAVQHRRGAADHEIAFMGGISEALTGPLGGYLGAEFARDMRKGTRDWGTVGYVGAASGLDGWMGTFDPLHKYAQLSAGLVLGKITGRSRPELHLRVSLQAGLLDWDPYGLTLLSVEPRWRMGAGSVQVFAGLGIDVGYMLCEDCAAGQTGKGSPLIGLRPLVGVTLP